MHQAFTTRPARGSEQRAGNGTRTRDPNLGKVVLYQLSYSRENPVTGNGPETGSVPQPIRLPGNGGEGNRTPDLLNAIQALSQLSYAPGRTVPIRRRRSFQELASLAGGMSSVKTPRDEIGTGVPLMGRYLAALLRQGAPTAFTAWIAATMNNSFASGKRARLSICHGALVCVRYNSQLTKS